MVFEDGYWVKGQLFGDPDNSYILGPNAVNWFGVCADNMGIEFEGLDMWSCVWKGSQLSLLLGVTVAVIDTIFNPRKLSKEDVNNLRYIPHTNNVEFILEAAKVMTGANVLVPVVECRAPYKIYLDTVAYRQNIINLIDDRENNFNAYAGLKFGSMEGSNNEAGNWE